MCLDPAIVQKLQHKRGEIIEYNGHWCSPECPVCWVFAEEWIQDRLFRGNTLESEKVNLRHLLNAADLGCRFSKDVLERLVLTAKGEPVELDAKLSISLKKEGIPASQRLVITIKSRGAEKPAPWLGPGYTIQSDNSYDIPYAIFAYHNDPAAQYIKTRPANAYVDSDATFATARGWMADCAKSHKNCPGFSFWADGKLPTRVIDVGLDGGEVRLRLSRDIDGRDAARVYVALSYVWGRDQPKTMTYNVDERYESLAGISLPQTIVDAIRTTQSLGIPFLWVDSLCIVQDSPDDMSVEISRMAQIYKSAIVTISAARANHCDEGFLQPRERVLSILASSPEVPFRLPDQVPQDHPLKKGFLSRLLWRNDNDQDKVMFGQVGLCADMSCGHDLSKMTGHNIIEPITKRAWTLQESWLSPRVLIYGEGPLRWKCLSGEKIDGYETGSQLGLLSLIAENRQLFFPQNDNITGDAEASSSLLSTVQSWRAGDDDLVSRWMSLVEIFSRRNLTKPEDKLPALSGIATEFHKISQDNFYAGLWKSTMIEQLLWHQVGDDPPRGLPPSYRAPSWSWAAVEGGVSFSVDAPPSLAFLTVGAPRDTPDSARLTIHSCTTTIAEPLEPFGRVVAGELTLSAPARQMSWDEVEQRFDVYVKSQPNYFSDYIVPDGGAESPLCVSSVETSQDISRRLQRFWFVELTRQAGPAGLVLVVNEDGKYKRMAYFRLGSREEIRNEAIEYELGGGARKRPRQWDWEDGLHVKTMTIV